MKAPECVGNDYEWVTDHSSLISEYVFRAEDPNKYLQLLPQWQSRLYYLSSGTLGIMNGGLESYLAGTHGDEAEELLEALEHVSSLEMARTIRDMLDLFPDSKIPKDYEMRVRCIEDILSKNNARRLDDLVNVVIDNNIWELIRKLELDQ